jgi:hypothetical protein
MLEAMEVARKMQRTKRYDEDNRKIERRNTDKHLKDLQKQFEDSKHQLATEYKKLKGEHTKLLKKLSAQEETLRVQAISIAEYDNVCVNQGILESAASHGQSAGEEAFKNNISDPVTVVVPYAQSRADAKSPSTLVQDRNADFDKTGKQIVAAKSSPDQRVADDDNARDTETPPCSRVGEAPVVEAKKDEAKVSTVGAGSQDEPDNAIAETVDQEGEVEKPKEDKARDHPMSTDTTEPPDVTGPPPDVTGPPPDVTGPPPDVTGPPPNVTGPPPSEPPLKATKRVPQDTESKQVSMGPPPATVIPPQSDRIVKELKKIPKKGSSSSSSSSSNSSSSSSNSSSSSSSSTIGAKANLKGNPPTSAKKTVPLKVAPVKKPAKPSPKGGKQKSPTGKRKQSKSTDAKSKTTKKFKAGAKTTSETSSEEGDDEGESDSDSRASGDENSDYKPTDSNSD